MKSNSLIWTILLKLPTFVKTTVLRKVVSFPTDISETLSFKVAETEEELSQAFALLHDAYVNEKLMDPHPSGMRVTKYHALPSTTTLIAVEGDKVVGTVSLIRQSSFGLPLKSIFDLTQVPARARLAEVSALAIKKEHLHQRGRILFPLLKFLFHYSYDYFGVSHFVIAVNPKWIDFYTSILAFKPLTKSVVQNYSFVNGAPAVGAILDLEYASEVYYKIYGAKPKKRNLYAFFRELECKNMQFPLRKKSIISDPVLTPDMLNTFFNVETECMKTMSENEHAILREMYDHPEYLQWIPNPGVVSFRKKRIAKRFESTMHGRLLLPGNRSSQLFIQGVSRFGIGGFLHEGTEISEGKHKILVNIEDVIPCELEGSFVRLEKNGHFGFAIEKSCERWASLVESLNSRMQLTIGAVVQETKQKTS